MKKQKEICTAAAFLAAFALWTILVCIADVQPIGPEGTPVGFAAVNGYVHNLTGVHPELYELTDLLSLIPLGIVSGFGILGLMQWIRRRSLKKVDGDILLLGGFYGVVLGAYGFFEIFVVNYRPVLIEGRLEASYPSSTTVLVLCVMLTAVMQMNLRIRHRGLKKAAAFIMTAFSVFMVMGRFLSGVHWFTDIAGGILLSGGLVLLYRAMCGKFR